MDGSSRPGDVLGDSAETSVVDADDSAQTRFYRVRVLGE
jgi:hypothetical protein